MEQHYLVLQRPLVTEKSTQQAAHNVVAFVVSPGATKAAIKAAVEALYKVTVERVNTLNGHAKQKAFRGRLGQRSAVRKAYVKLAAGQTIDLSKGV